MGIFEQVRNQIERARAKRRTRGQKLSDLPPEIAPMPVREEPEYLKGIERKVTKCAPPNTATAVRPSLEEAREIVRNAILYYLLQDDPEEILLVKAVPGIGKTTVAVFAAEVMAERGKRVLYAGPRHNFFQDVLAMADRPEWWYEWLPRRKADEDTGATETCRYAEEVTTWLARGYKAIDFCRRICGWDYVNVACPYYAQKKCGVPIIFGQHQHVVLGHPLEFGVVIGDEYPVPAFCHEWRIPARWIMPPGMNPEEPLTELLHTLSVSVPKEGADPSRVDGESLLALLGGPDAVLEACEGFTMPVAAEVIPPDLHHAGEVEEVPYAHLPHLVPLLIREARMAQKGEQYPHRVILHQQGLDLLLRYPPNARLPRHMIWLDATANKILYETCFQRPAKVIDAQPELKARIYQVHTRANGKVTLLDKDGQPTSKVAQTELQVARIIEIGKYTRPVLVTFQSLIKASETFSAIDHTHYYAARGTNAFEDADAIIIAGTPQPPLASIERMARMVFFERDTAFHTRWASKQREYNYIDPDDGKGRQYPVSEFCDAELNALLWSLREAEIIQAAHRCRPVNHDADIWLLTNIPIDELPPTKLLDIAELLDAPPNVNAFLWYRAFQIAQQCNARKGRVMVEDLVEAGIHVDTARKYLHRLHEELGWDIESVSSGKRGRPKLAVRRE